MGLADYSAASSGAGRTVVPLPGVVLPEEPPAVEPPVDELSVDELLLSVEVLPVEVLPVDVLPDVEDPADDEASAEGVVVEDVPDPVPVVAVPDVELPVVPEASLPEGAAVPEVEPVEAAPFVVDGVVVGVVTGVVVVPGVVSGVVVASLVVPVVVLAGVLSAGVVSAAGVAGRVAAGVARRVVVAGAELARTCALGIASVGPAQPVRRWPPAESRAVKGYLVSDIPSEQAAACRFRVKGRPFITPMNSTPRP